MCLKKSTVSQINNITDDKYHCNILQHNSYNRHLDVCEASIMSKVTKVMTAKEMVRQKGTWIIKYTCV